MSWKFGPKKVLTTKKYVRNKICLFSLAFVLDGMDLFDTELNLTSAHTHKRGLDSFKITLYSGFLGQLLDIPLCCPWQDGVVGDPLLSADQHVQHHQHGVPHSAGPDLHLHLVAGLHCLCSGCCGRICRYWAQ